MLAIINTSENPRELYATIFAVIPKYWHGLTSKNNN
jgi:hypothetical protein